MSGQVERRPSTSSHITFAVLQQHFHLPISQVAKELGVCATVLKKICRQQGIPRWPHRKIKSLNKMISNLEEEIEAAETAEEKQQREIELRALKKKKAEIIETPSIIGPTYSHISPRLDGKPVNPISKFSSSGNSILGSSEENLMREQNVRDILQTQRKLSAPAFSFSNTSTGNLKDFDAPNIPPAQNFYPSEFSSLGRNSYAPTYPAQTDYHGRPSSIVRSSAPDVLEGISSHQMEALYSMYSRHPPTSGGERSFHPPSFSGSTTEEDRYQPYTPSSNSNYLASFPHVSNSATSQSHLPNLEDNAQQSPSQFNYDMQRRDSFQGPSSLYQRSSDVPPMHQTGYLPAPVKNERSEYPSLPHLSGKSAYPSSLDVGYGESQKVQINQSAQYSSHSSGGYAYQSRDDPPQGHHTPQHSYTHSSLPYPGVGELPYSRPNVPPLSSRGFPDQKHNSENYTTSA